MQFNSKMLDHMSKSPRLAITYARSPPPINRLINDRLSVSQTLPQLIKMSHRMLTDPLL